MRLLTIIWKGLKMFWTFLTRIIKAVRIRRVHVWAAFYFIGIWNFLEPMITFFGFSDPTIEIIRNLGIAVFPLIIISAWFHGEPGTQKFKPVEGASLIFGLVLASFIYYNLSRTPTPVYSVIVPYSNEQKAEFHENVLRRFEEKHKVQIVLKSFDENYEENLFNVLNSEQDSSNVILAKVPLHYTGILLNGNRARLISYDDLVSQSATLDERPLDSLLAQLDADAVRLGRRQTTSGELYFMPAEFQTTVLVYSTSKVADAVQNWQSQKPLVDAAFYAITGHSLPADYRLEDNPELWDYFDMFTVNWYWTHQSDEGYGTPKFASPCFKDEKMVTYLMNRALSHGASLEQVFNLPYKTDVFPPAAIAEMYYWEAIFRRAGLYYSGMWLGDGITEPEIVELLKTGKIYMAFVSNDQLPNLLANQADLQIATLPAGASVTGKRGLKKGLLDVWFWAAPAVSPAQDLSCKLAFYLSQKKSQKKIAQKFYAIPTRKKLLNDEILKAEPAHPIWPVLIDQVHINKKSEQGINPYKHFQKSNYDILVQFYYMKWQAIVKGEGFLTLREKFNEKSIVGILML
ncbi:MAG: extracellular solute-binding protein [bacterium]